MRSAFTLTSPDPPGVVRARLAAACPAAFRGRVWGGGFKLTRRLTRLEQSMRVVGTGRIAAAAAGTVVRVVTRPQWEVVGYLGLWSAFWLRLVALTTDWREGVVGVGMIGFAWVLAFGATTAEARRFRAELAAVVCPAPCSEAG